MANICITSFDITSDNKELLGELYNFIQECLKEDRRSFTNVLLKLNSPFIEITEKNDNDFTYYQCGVNILKYSKIIRDMNLKGDIIHCNYLTDNTLSVVTESKWSPTADVIFAITEHFFNDNTEDYSISYTAEEPGMGIFVSDYFPNEKRFCVDSCSENLIPEDVKKEYSNDLLPGLNIDNTIKVLQYNLNTAEENIDTLLKMLEDNEKLNCDLFIHEYDYYPIEEYLSDK